ncbi:hypothetical protein V2G26_003257 [Clonostachys chloroleuca]
MQAPNSVVSGHPSLALAQLCQPSFPWATHRGLELPDAALCPVRVPSPSSHLANLRTEIFSMFECRLAAWLVPQAFRHLSTPISANLSDLRIKISLALEATNCHRSLAEVVVGQLAA